MISNAIGFALCFLAVIGGIGLLSRLHFGREHDVLLERFNRDRRHLTFEERQAELALRTSLARIRRVASHAALQRPREAQAILERVAEHEVGLLAARSPEIARRLAEYLHEASHHELLYPAALHAAATTRRARARKPGPDDIAALRIID